MLYLKEEREIACKYDSLSQAEEEEEEAEEEGKQDAQLRVVTYNVWFADLHWEARARALFDILRGTRAHVIALQVSTRILG